MLKRFKPNHDQSADLLIQDWRSAFKLALAIYLPLRLLLLVVGAVYASITMQTTPANFGDWLNALLIQPWNHQDAMWYERIATTGYSVVDGRAAFHPLLPLLMRIVGAPLGHNYILAGLIVNDVACVSALAVMLRFITLDYDSNTAFHASTWLMYSPVGFIMLIPYTEAMTLAFILLAWWYARHNRWLAAGLWGCMATLTKHSAIVLVVGLVCEYLFIQRRKLWSRRTIQVMMCLSLIPLGYLAFALYRQLMAPFELNGIGEMIKAMLVSPQLVRRWGHTFGMPYQWVAEIIDFIVAGETYGWFWLNLVLTIIFIGLTVRSVRHSRPAVSIYGVITTFLVMTNILLGDPIMSVPRRFVLIFAAFVQIGIWSSRSPRLYQWRLLSLVLQIFFVLGYLANRYVP